MELSDRQYLKGVMLWSFILMGLGTAPLFFIDRHLGISYLIGVVLSLLNISLLIYTIQKLLLQQGNKSPLLLLISFGKLGLIGLILHLLFSPPAAIKPFFQADGIGLLIGLSLPFILLIFRGYLHYNRTLIHDLSKE